MIIKFKKFKTMHPSGYHHGEFFGFHVPKYVIFGLMISLCIISTNAVVTMIIDYQEARIYVYQMFSGNV